jgi:hypothetical protein
MSDETFVEVKNALKDALAYERGKRRLYVTRIRVGRVGPKRKSH